MANFYMACFIIGFALTAISFLMGFAGHGFGHGADVGHGADAGHGGDAGGSVGDDGPRTVFHRGKGVSLINFGTVTAFLTWFGGIGFLVTAYSHVLALVTIIVALGGGIVGAGVIFLFMAKVLTPDAVPLDPADYHMPGTLGRVTVTVPGNGTGEMVYTQGGTRKTVAVRGAEGQDIVRGTEVVVMRYEHGIAYARPWDHVADGHREDSPT